MLSLSQRYVSIVQVLQPSLPPTCRWLIPEDINLIGKLPIAAGAFANIYQATCDGRKVVLKSYRPYISLDAAQVVAVGLTYIHNLCRVHC